MSKLSFSLNLENVKKIPIDKYEQNFTFNVNGKQYQTNRFVADLLSPIIRNYHYQDPTLNEFTINTNATSSENLAKSNKENNDYFDDFLKLANFIEIQLDESDPRIKIFGEYFQELGNHESYFKLHKEIFSYMSVENFLDKINDINSMNEKQKNANDEYETNYEFYDEMKELFEYASIHFHELDKEKLKNLDKKLFKEIISLETLQLENEDELLEMINEIYEKDNQFFPLYQFVEFENASEESVEHFIEIFSIEDLCNETWKSICRRLVPSKKDQRETRKSERYCSRIVSKEYEEGKEFHGILRYLTEESNGNIHDNGTIEITSNSVYNSCYPKNLVDYQNDNYYETDNKENSMVCFDFKDKSIQISSYSIKTMNWSQNSNHLKNWVVEVSNDNDNWIKIDEHQDDSALNGPNIIHTFKIKESTQFYRFIRLRQTGTNWYNNYYTALYFLEFYGKLNQLPTIKTK